MSKAREVNAFLIEISMLPSHAPSIRTCETRFPPSSQTAMFIGCPIWAAFFSAAAMSRRASSSLMPMCLPFRGQFPHVLVGTAAAGEGEVRAPMEDEDDNKRRNTPRSPPLGPERTGCHNGPAYTDSH